MSLDDPAYGRWLDVFFNLSFLRSILLLAISQEMAIPLYACLSKREMPGLQQELPD